MANSILFCIALVLCAIGQRVVAFQSITSLRSQLKVLQQNRLSSTSENAPTEVEKPRAETLSDAYISPLSIEPSVVTAADPDIASKIKSGVRNFPILSELQLSSIFGSTLTGLILGGISDFSLPSTIEPWIAPLIGSLWFGGGSLLIEQSDSDKAKNVVQTIFGKPTLTVKNKIQKSITTTIDNTIAAIVKKKNDVVNGIKAIPTNVKLAILASLDNTKNKIQKKTNEAVDKVLESPRLFINGVRKNIDDKVTEVKTSIKNQVDAVLAGPRELQVTIAKSINSITNPEPPQAVEIKEVPPTEVNAVQAIKQVIETETERPKVSPKRIEEPAQLKLPTLSLNLPFGGDKKEEKATKKEPVAVAQKPIVQQPAAPAKQSSNTVKSSSAAPSPFQFSFGGLNTYSKGSSSVTTKVTAAPKAVVSTSNSAKTTQTSLKETTVSKSTPQISTPAPKPAEKTGGFLSFLASASPPQTSAKSPVPPSATSKVSVKPATPASQSSPVKKEAERKTASSSSLFTFNFGGKSSETYAAPKVTTATSVKASTSAPAKSTSAPAPAPAKASPPQPSKPLFSTGSVKSSSSVTSPSQITATKKTEASSPAKPLFSTGSVKTSQSSTSATSSKPSTPIASKPLFSTGSIKTSTSASAAPSNTNSKTSPTSTTAPSLLSTSAVKTLKGYSLGDVSISTIDTATQQYNSGKISARQLYATVLNEVKSKDRTNNALPYIIGSLPQGQQKLELNQYYQQIA